MESETIDLMPLIPLVDKFLQEYYTKEERDKLFDEVRSKVNNDKEFLKHIYSKGEDERSLLLLYLRVEKSMDEDREYYEEAVEVAIKELENNKDKYKSIMDTYRKLGNSEVEIFGRVINDILLDTSYTLIIGYIEEARGLTRELIKEHKGEYK